MAHRNAEARQQSSDSKGHKSKRICDRYTDGESHHIGSPCELSVMKLYGLPYDLTVDKFKSIGDVCGMEVRGRTGLDEERHDLIVRPDDPLDRIYVLVTTNDWTTPNNMFYVKGWMRGESAAVPKYWKDPGKKNAPAWFVPVIDLHPMPLRLPPEWL